MILLIVKASKCMLINFTSQSCRQTIFPKYFKVDWRGAQWKGWWCYHCSSWEQDWPCWQKV